MKLIFDIETDGLIENVSKLHCIVMVDANTKKAYVCSDAPLKGVTNTLAEGLELLHNASLLIGHNIIGYDIPVLEKLYGIQFTNATYDTLIASKLKYNNLAMIDSNIKRLPPKLKGSHSLKAWGYRLNVLKGEFGSEAEQWEVLTQDMLDYCIQDVRVTYSFYNKIMLDPPPKNAMNIEQAFKKVIVRQENYGWLFDIATAKKLHIELLTSKEKAYTELLTVFKPIKTWIPKSYPKVATKKDGSKSQVLLTQELNGYHFNKDMEWGRYEDIEFNPQSVDHRVKFIEHYFGKVKWELNENGNPKTGESDLIKLFEDKDFAKPLVNYLNISKLLGQLAEGKNAWLNSVRADNRIYGSVDTLGAVSRRCTHSKPNMAQVPSSRAYKGHECRSLFTVGKGKKLVGCDADGLELRTLSHYMSKFDEGEYAKTVDEGKKEEGTDIHTMNQKAAGLPTRDDAKTFIYAFLYGAGDEKIGSIVGGTAKEGKAIKAKFFKKIPAIKKLIESVVKEVKETKFLLALDGNRYHIRSPHSALNTLLQGAGALVMKYYLVVLDKELSKKYKAGSNYEFVGNIHDEVQIECDEDIAEDVAKIAVSTFDKVTTLLKFKIPLRGSASIGNSWADTH